MLDERLVGEFPGLADAPREHRAEQGANRIAAGRYRVDPAAGTYRLEVGRRHYAGTVGDPTRRLAAHVKRHRDRDRDG